MSKRRPIIAGNWKMHMTGPEAVSLARSIVLKFVNVTDVDVVICPPFTALSVVSDIIKESSIGLGAQNMHWEEGGAYTGEISSGMLKAAGCEWVIIGHSERRQFFGETDETVNKRLRRALSDELDPILCVGETLQQRQTGSTEDVVGGQLRGGLAGFSPEEVSQMTVAYEPVWAIGTGVNATPEQAEAVHGFIRGVLAESFGDRVASAVRIQYGGSVKPENAEGLLGQPNIDGALVGGASLKADSFAAIARAAG